MTSAAQPWVDSLAAEKALLDRTSTAERVADLLRRHIVEGTLAPGTRLSEASVGRALSVSRNTLREAFRLLAHERLLVYAFHRGVFVRELTAGDVADLYRTRRMIETAALRAAEAATSVALQGVHDAVTDGERAADDERWHDVGTANMRFHQAVADLAGSERSTEIMRRLLAELRLAFHAMPALREFHEPYLADNRAIADLLAAGNVKQASQRLTRYFDTAERQLLDVYRDTE